MSDYSIVIRQNFGYSEEVFDTWVPSLVLLIDELQFITRWANQEEIEGLQSLIENGSWDFSESDLTYPLYKDADPLDGEYDYEIIIERMK